ncbi:short-chain dehydrogenase/reductase family protein [Apiospora sp. TS-2023a]
MTVTASRALGPNPQSFGSMFWENQFKTTIPLPPQDGSLKNQVAIITGANSGMGFESAKQMLQAGLSRLVMGVRSTQRGEDAATQLRPLNPGATIHVWEVDMESYASIQAFARRCEAELPRIDFAILNAGIAPADHVVLEETGHESTVQVNYLSTVLLSILLLPVLKAKRPAGNDRAPRLITLGSVTARNAKFLNRHERPLLASFDTVTADVAPWDPSDRYAVSKLLCQMTLERVAARYVDARDVVILQLEPGWVRGTGLFRGLPAVARFVVGLLLWVCGRPLARGAATYFDAAVRQGGGGMGAEGVTQALWDETMKELEFANALGILESMKRS